MEKDDELGQVIQDSIEAILNIKEIIYTSNDLDLLYSLMSNGANLVAFLKENNVTLEYSL